MANWKILSGDDIRLLDTERTIMANATPLQDIDGCVLSASNYVRGYVEGGGNTMEPSPAVPPECVDDVVAIARYTYLAQDPTGTLLTPIRQKERDDAYKHLVDVAKEVAAVTQGELPPDTTDITIGKWGSAPRIVMRTEFTPPP
jgi:hypothetical protein